MAARSFFESLRITAVLGIFFLGSYLAIEPALGADPDPSEFAYHSEVLPNYVKKYATNLDLAELARSHPVQVLIIGESHPDAAPKTLLKREMKNLKDAGVTHLALEMFNSQEQALLDSYSNNLVSNETLEETLRPDNYWGWFPAKYVQVIETARTHGLGILALDGRDLAEQQPSSTNSLHFRNNHMAETLRLFFEKNPSARVVMLTGSAHAQCCSSPNLFPTQLEKRGISYLTLSVDNKDYRQFKGPIRASLEETGIGTNNIFVPLPRAKANYDGFLYLDQFQESLLPF